MPRRLALDPTDRRPEPLQYAGLILGAIGLLIAVAAFVYDPALGDTGGGLRFSRQFMAFLAGLAGLLVGAILFGAGRVSEALAVRKGRTGKEG